MYLRQMWNFNFEIYSFLDSSCSVDIVGMESVRSETDFAAESERKGVDFVARPVGESVDFSVGQKRETVKFAAGSVKKA